MDNKEYTHNIQVIISYGLENIDPKEKIEVNLKDLIYVYKTLQEYVRFFHQPLHYEKLEDVNDFLGDFKNQRAFQSLNTCVYDKMDKMIPKHIEDMYENEIFEHPKMPFYFKPNEQ